MRAIALLAAVVAMATGLAAPPAQGASRKEIPRIFKAIAKSWKKGKVDDIVARLAKKEKVTLALRGVKSGRYRLEQAKALLKKYFGSIETKKFKLDDGPHGSTARFKHVFEVKADRHEETRFTYITLDREDNRWVIVDILED